MGALLASIPVRAVHRPGVMTFEHKVVEVQAVRVLRWPASRHTHLNRWHYAVDIADHPELSPEAVRTGIGGAYRLRVDRRLNPRWKPPVFPAGAGVVEITPAAGAIAPQAA